MEAENFKIPVGGKGIIAGTALGAGPRLLLCFHGFGQSRKLFRHLIPADLHGWRVVLLDLPFFGESEWPEAAGPVLPEDWAAFLDTLLQRYPCDELHFWAFSLGAKVALGLYQATQLPVKRVVLISPDGLRIHPVYRFCIYIPIGRALFYTVLRWPGLFLFIWKMLHKLRITDPFKFRFLQKQFDTPEKRALLRRVWRGHSRIRPDIPVIARKSEQTQTDWHVIWGEHDNVLSVEIGRDFIQKVKDAKLHVLDGGHFLLNPPHEMVRSLLNSFLEA